MNRGISVLLCYFLVCFGMWAQPANDACFNAAFIDNPINYCSAEGAYTTEGATNEGLASAGCFNGSGPDVWFSFVATGSSVSVSIIGNAGGGVGGTLTNPELALFTTPNCINFTAVSGGLACKSDLGGLGNVQLIWSGLVVGQTYYIRVQGSNEGSFTLCVNSFFMPATPGSDYVTASYLCDKSTFSVEQISGVGLEPDEGAGTCLDPAGTGSEDQSVWFKFIAKTSGTLEFTFAPLLRSDDLDFAIWEFPNGIDDPSGKILLRCNATFGGDGAACGPDTGLRAGETDNEEDAGCDPGENGFNTPADLIAGRAYGILVNNFSQSGSGFEVTFGGTAEFQGPEPDFMIEATQAFECDKTVILTDLSTATGIDNIVSWSWIFGQGANPPTGTGQGPHNVIFESFGPKTVVLTVESEKGCLVSVTQTIDIASCCQDFDALEVRIVDQGDNVCAGEQNGFFELETTGGNGPYSYNVNDSRFLELDRYEQLAAGVYNVEVQDIKGCATQIDVTIQDGLKLLVELGDDRTIQLGGQTRLNSFVTPAGQPVSITWSPSMGLDCTDCFEPLASPYVTTTYIATIRDSTGCTATDSVTVRVEAVRNVYIPNAFTPHNLDGSNDVFTVFGGLGTAENGIVELKIFNRWGDLVFDGRNLPFGSQTFSQGWDGRFKGVMQNPGVYTYMAKIRFLDDEVIVYKGDVTLIR